MNFILRANELSHVFHFFLNKFGEEMKYSGCMVRLCMPVFFEGEVNGIEIDYEFEVIVSDRYELIEMNYYGKT